MAKATVKAPKKVLEIRRAVEVVVRVPVDEQSYPGMNHVQAIDYELRLPRADKLDQLLLVIEEIPAAEVALTESIKVVDE